MSAWASVKTYQLTVHTDLIKSGKQYLSLSWNTQGETDLAGNKIHQTLSGNITGTGAQSKIEKYLVEGYEYQKPGEGTSWFKYRSSSEAFQRQNLVGRQVNLLTGATKIELAGTEQVDGVSCQKLRIVPDPQKLMTFTEVGQPSAQQPGAEPPEVEASNVDVTLCVSTATRLPVKTELHFVVVSEGIKSQVDMVTTVQNVNGAIQVQLPPEAVNAVEFPAPPSS